MGVLWSVLVAADGVFFEIGGSPVLLLPPSKGSCESKIAEDPEPLKVNCELLSASPCKNESKSKPSRTSAEASVTTSKLYSAVLFFNGNQY